MRRCRGFGCPVVGIAIGLLRQCVDLEESFSGAVVLAGNNHGVVSGNEFDYKGRVQTSSREGKGADLRGGRYDSIWCCVRITRNGLSLPVIIGGEGGPTDADDFDGGIGERVFYAKGIEGRANASDE
jgi:hypothetical protein